MIVLRNLTKTFLMQGRRKTVADNINVTFPTGASVALLGRNGAGKSTLLKMIAGTTTPTSGEILSTGTVSFPVGLASSLHPDLSGAQNTRFVARIYGADTDALMAYVKEFADLGDHFHLPIRSYSSGMKGRLSFGINMGLEFDTYLIDEVTAVGDAAFKYKSRDVFLNRMTTAGSVFVSHSMGTIREMCKSGALLEDGHLHYYEDVEDAIERYMFAIEGVLSVLQPPRPEVAVAQGFPRDARMLFGIGAPQTQAEWLGDCLRRHRPCHFAPTREPHYFDIRAGRSQTLLQRRLRTAKKLAARISENSDATRRNSVRLLGEVSDLLTIHTAPQDGPDRHDAYVDYLLKKRKVQPIVCDFTPSYALLERTDFAEMAMIGSARFVLVLRDPATRLWAQIWESLPSKRRSPEACSEVAERLIGDPATLADWPESDYARTMRDLEAAVGSPARILYLFHEDLRDQKSLMPLCDFLDVPTIPSIKVPPLPEDGTPPLPDALRQGLRTLLAAQYAEAEKRFGANLPAAWRDATRHPARAADPGGETAPDQEARSGRPTAL